MFWKCFVCIFFFMGLLSANEWQRVYLASFPRSGNHWTRYVVEDATKIATSSVYCDRDPLHLAEPFAWGGYCAPYGYLGHCRYPEKNEAVLIKTHFPFHTSKYDHEPTVATVRLIRNPIDSIWSCYVYNGKKTNYIGREFLIKILKGWVEFNKYWDQQENVLTMRYEDLLDDPYTHFKTIINFVYPDTSDDSIQAAVEKFSPKGHELKHLKRYRKKDLELVREIAGKLMKKYGFIVP